jgi:hypothetical protein
VPYRVLLRVEPTILADLIEEELRADPALEVERDDEGRPICEAFAGRSPNVVITNLSGTKLDRDSQEFLLGSELRALVGVDAADDRHPATVFDVEAVSSHLGELAPGMLRAVIEARALDRDEPTNTEPP